MALKDLLDAARRRLGLVDPIAEDLKDLPREDIRLSNPWHSVAIQPGPKDYDIARKLQAGGAQ